MFISSEEILIMSQGTVPQRSIRSISGREEAENNDALIQSA
jgi:hypothetical protein